MKRLVLLALPTTAAFGSLIPGIGPLFGFRLLVILLGLLTLGRLQSSVHNLSMVFAFRVLVVAWTVTGLIGSFFISDFYAGLRAFVPLLIGFVLIYVLAHARNPSSALEYIQRGWVIAYVATGAIAFREMTTGVHMPNYLPSSDHALVGSTRLIASVFGNPNAYGTFLVTTFAFLVYGLLKSDARRSRYLYMALILILVFLTLSTGSRFCLIALLIEAVFFALYAGDRYRRSLLSGILLIILALFCLGVGAADSLTSYLPGKLATATPSQMIDEVLTGEADTSGARRLGLYLDGLWIVADSAGLGVGPGAFQDVMSSGRPPYDSGGVVDPHNLYFEIAAQYGLLVFGLFLAWIYALAATLFRAAKTASGVARLWGIAMCGALAGNAVSALANSSYLPSSVNWVFLASLSLAAVAVAREAHEQEPARTSPARGTGHRGLPTSADSPSIARV